MHRNIYVNRNILGMDVHPYDRPYLAAFVYADCKPVRAAMLEAGGGGVCCATLTSLPSSEPYHSLVLVSVYISHLKNNQPIWLWIKKETIIKRALCVCVYEW